MPDIDNYQAAFPRTGCLEWIGLASEKRGNLRPVEEAVLHVGTGIEGEHHARSGNSERQVTLIQAEHLPAIAALAGRETVSPRLLRRNLVVSGVNLTALKKKRFRIGEVLLEGTTACAPCSRMEETLGLGGFNAMRGHGGLCAIVIEPGTIRIGDAVEYAGEALSQERTTK